MNISWFKRIDFYKLLLLHYMYLYLLHIYVIYLFCIDIYIICICSAMNDISSIFRTFPHLRILKGQVRFLFLENVTVKQLFPDAARDSVRISGVFIYGLYSHGAASGSETQQ